MNNRKVIIVSIIVLVVMALIGIVWWVSRPAPEAPPAPTAVPLPTEVPLIQISGVGGVAFFTDPRMVARMAELGYEVTILSNSGADAYPSADAPDYATVDFLQPGSPSAEAEMKVRYGGTALPSTGDPKTIGTTVAFARTPYPFFVKRPLAEAMVEAGMAYMDGEVFRMTAENVQLLFDADVEGYCWMYDPDSLSCNDETKTLGVDYPGKVILAFPNPAKSSGGRTAVGYALAFADGDGGEYAVTPEQILDPFYQNYIIRLIVNAGSVPGRDDSLLTCTNFLDTQETATPIMVAGESCYVGWWTGLSDTLKSRNADSNVLIYPEKLIMGQFILIPVDPIGKTFVDIIANDDVIRQILSEMGYRAGAYNDAPTFAATWIDGEAKFGVVPNFLPEIGTVIKQIAVDFDQGIIK